MFRFFFPFFFFFKIKDGEGVPPSLKLEHFGFFLPRADRLLMSPLSPNGGQPASAPTPRRASGNGSKQQVRAACGRELRACMHQTPDSLLPQAPLQGLGEHPFRVLGAPLPGPCGAPLQGLVGTPPGLWGPTLRAARAFTPSSPRAHRATPPQHPPCPPASPPPTLPAWHLWHSLDDTGTPSAASHDPPKLSRGASSKFAQPLVAVGSPAGSSQSVICSLLLPSMICLLASAPSATGKTPPGASGPLELASPVRSL